MPKSFFPACPFRYFTPEALQCYWLELLTRFSKLLTYRPQRGPGAAGWKGRRGETGRFYMTVQQYLDTVAKSHKGGHLLGWYETDESSTATLVGGAMKPG